MTREHQAGLRTHLVISLALIVAFAASSGASFWYRNVAERSFDESLQQRLFLLTELPRLRGEIRKTDLLTELTIRTKDPRWLEQRQEDIDNLYVFCRELAARIYDSRLQGLLLAFQKQLDVFLENQDQAIRDRDQKTTAKFLQSMAATKKEQTTLLALVTEIGQTTVSQMDIHEQHFQKEILISFLLRCAVELTGAILIAFYFLYFVLRPMAQIDRAAAEWELGNPWDIKAADDSRELYRMISSNVDVLTNAVQNLLSMSRLESGKLALELSEIEAGAILNESITRFKILADRKRLALELRIPDTPIVVRADSATLGLVVSNLLVNAIKYTPESGSVTVGISNAGMPQGRCRIYVQDTGIGISPEERGKIIGGHYRTTNARKMTSKGFGIGLSLANQIIQAHGSVLEIESAPGKGLNFHSPYRRRRFGIFRLPPPGSFGPGGSPNAGPCRR